MPVICTILSGIKTTYYLDNKYVEPSLSTMRNIVSHTFRQPPYLIRQPYAMAQASSKPRLWGLRRFIRACRIVTDKGLLLYTLYWLGWDLHPWGVKSASSIL